MRTDLSILVSFFLVVTNAISFSCKKNESLKDAVITGWDNRMCPCCGGLMINFDGETQPYIGDYFLIENEPSEFDITNTSIFPIKVKVDWQRDSTKCSGKMIKITKFARGV